MVKILKTDNINYDKVKIWHLSYRTEEGKDPKDLSHFSIIELTDNDSQVCIDSEGTCEIDKNGHAKMRLGAGKYLLETIKEV